MYLSHRRKILRYVKKDLWRKKALLFFIIII